MYMSRPRQQVVIEVALTTRALHPPDLVFRSPDLTSEQIAASDRELGLTEWPQHRSSSSSTHLREWLHKSPDIGGTRKAQQNVSLCICPRSDRSSNHPSPRATMIRPPQLIAHSSQGKRAPTPCYDRAGLGRVPVRRISLIFDRDSRERGSWQAGTVYLLIGALLSCCGE